MARRIETVWDGAMALGEGPFWDDRGSCLWFVDIKQRRVHRLDPATGAVATWPAPAQVGWVVPARGGGLIAGLQDGLARFDPATGGFEPIADVEPELPGNRLNDATVGPDGSIWFGTMDDAHERCSGRLYRFDGSTLARLAIAPMAIANGPAVTPDGRTLYYADTAERRIFAATVTPDNGVGPPRVFATIDPADGYPDGLIVDAAGHVWVALWDGWCARRYAPDGELIETVDFPVSRVTKIALGGADLKTAFATSARTGFSAEEIAAQPLAGSVFSFRVEVPGQAFPLAR